ncbi:MAG: sugar kinase [Desulfovibrio sp.]|nr:sugar kinase [Desulfovibrio sp.]
MPWLICGTVPDEHFELVHTKWHLDGDTLRTEEGSTPEIAVHRGTPALLATAILACTALEVELPEALLVGDTGQGKGSRRLYAELANGLKGASLSGVTFHYLYPDIDAHNRVLMAMEERDPRPLLVADAGFMYVAKMSGYATSYDMFTPDVGELAFLADEKSPHPFYTRGFLLAEEKDIPRLVARAYGHDNAARCLLIKGSTDHIYLGGTFKGCVTEPSVPAMEAIGGTGDIITGLVTALLMRGLALEHAAMAAAHVGRLLAKLVCPTPATQVAELLPHIPSALRIFLASDLGHDYVLNDMSQGKTSSSMENDS